MGILILVIGLATISRPALAQETLDPGVSAGLADNSFECDGSIYQVAGLSDGINTDAIIYTLEVRDGIYVYEPLAYPPYPSGFNALGFNVADGYLYMTFPQGPENTSGYGEIYRLGSDGRFINLGFPVSKTDPTQTWTSDGSNTGTFDGSGFMYIFDVSPDS